MLIKHLLEAAAALFFLTCLVLVIPIPRKGRLRRRDRDHSLVGDPWPGWRHADGKDAYEAATDPNLPAVGAGLDIVYGPAPLEGDVVRQADWKAAMTVPAPPIVALPCDPAIVEGWLSQAELDAKVTATIARADAMLAAK